MESKTGTPKKRYTVLIGLVSKCIYDVNVSKSQWLNEHIEGVVANVVFYHKLPHFSPSDRTLPIYD